MSLSTQESLALIWSLLFLWLGYASADDRPIRIGVGSCAHQDSSQRIWDAVSSWKPDLFVHLGDAVYADTRDSLVMRAIYDRASANEKFKGVRKHVPFLATWDDHDYGENDAGVSYPMRVASQRLFFEFWEEPASSDRIRRPGVYGSRVVSRDGRNVRVILLDTRFFRSDWSPDTSHGRRYRQDPDPAKTILGPDQWAWLDRELRKPADLRIIASSIQVVNDEHGWECWGNFPAERRKLFGLIESTGAEGVIFVSGDRHFTELSRDTGTGVYPLFDFTSSGLTQVARRGHLVPNSKRVGSAVTVQSFGGIAVDFTSGEGKVTFTAFDDSAAVVFEYSVPLDVLMMD